jgi:hypothetical protein
MVAKTRGKKQRSKRTTQKQQYPAGRITTLRNQQYLARPRDISTLRNADAFNKQHGGDDPAIEGIVDDIKTLKTKIAKPHTDGPKFKIDMIDSFYPIVSAFDKHIGKDITKKDLTALSKSLETFLETIEKNKPKLTQFYPSSYSEVIPREISRMIETIRVKSESIPTIVTETNTLSKKQQATIKKQVKEEKEQLEKERREKKRLEKEQLEREQLEKKQLEKERLENERIEKQRLKKERLENERLEKEQLEMQRLESELMNTEESDRKSYLLTVAKEEEKKKKEKKDKDDIIRRFEERDLELKQARLIEQFNNEIISLFKKISRNFKNHFKVLLDSNKLVSIIKEIYPNILNYTDTINTLEKDDKFLYKNYSFRLFIFIGMLNRFLKETVPDLKLVIKGGKAAQMILSPKPTLELKSDDIDVLVQHPDPLYAKIFSQHFALFFRDYIINDPQSLSILLANPINPNVSKISFITKYNRFVVISDIDSKPIERPEYFNIIETEKSKDINIVDKNKVETTYTFRLTYYHQNRESFIKEKKYYLNEYSALPPSDANSRFVSKASDYLTMMAPSVPPPSPASPEKYETFLPPSPPK